MLRLAACLLVHQACIDPLDDYLRADRFTPESFAYPYGSHTPETDALIAPHVRFMRTTNASGS